MPYVIVGHNQRIAWGFTNVGPTVTDVYIENFNAQGAYQTPSGWVQPEHRAEVIHVKGKPDVNRGCEDHAARTHHHRTCSGRNPAAGVALDALRQPAHSVFRCECGAELAGVPAARFRSWTRPDRTSFMPTSTETSDIRPPGKIPIRAAGDGSLPVSGADNAHEWTSYIPFEKLPSIYNPPSGIIATANGRITPDNYPNSISMEWEAPWRTARIYHVLESGRQFSAADMLALQTDIQSEADLFAAERFVYAVDHASKPSARAKQAADLMRSWDGRMQAPSAAPTIAENSILRTAAAAARTKAGKRRPPIPTKDRCSSELEDILVADALGVAGEYFAAPPEALAARRVSQLRRTACRGGGGGGQWSAGAKGSGIVALGHVQCGGDRASDPGQDSDSPPLVGARSAGAIRQRIHGEGGDAAITGRRSVSPRIWRTWISPR